MTFSIQILYHLVIMSHLGMNMIVQIGFKVY